MSCWNQLGVDSLQFEKVAVEPLLSMFAFLSLLFRAYAALFDHFRRHFLELRKCVELLERLENQVETEEIAGKVIG